MRAALLTLAFCLTAALSAKAQDVLKMIDGSEKQVKLIEVQDAKILYYEMGDPLTLEHDMPRSRVVKIIHEDGVVEALRKDPPKPGVVIVRKAAPDTAREAVILKTDEEIPAKILAVTDSTVSIRHRKGPKMGYQDRIRREAVARLRYPDGSERNLAKEEGERVQAQGRQLFDFTDESGPDLFFRQHLVTQAARSHGRLYTPDELLALKNYRDLKDALAHKTDVRFLDLHGQRLSKVPASALDLRRLVGIDLSNNPISSFPDELLALPNLQYIWLDSCQITELKPKVKNDVKSNLIFLSVRGNRIKELNPALAELPSLYVLRLSGNQISRVKGRSFFTSAPGKTSTLAAIDLARNGMEAVPAGLGTFPHLRYLRCRGNRLTDASGREGDLTRLTDLDLGDNPVANLDPALLTLPRLQYLYLDGPPAKTGTVPTVPPKLADSLSFVDVSGLPGSASVALALKARKPQTRVRYYSGLLGKVEESEAGAPGSLAEQLALAKKGTQEATLQLAKDLAQRGDYGLALAALAAAGTTETAPDGPLKTEQDRLRAEAEKR